VGVEHAFEPVIRDLPHLRVGEQALPALLVDARADLAHDRFNVYACALIWKVIAPEPASRPQGYRRPSAV